MYRGTTPTVTFNLSADFELSMIDKCYVTFKSRSGKHEITLEDVVINEEESTLSVTLSQEDTLSFDEGLVEIQIRIKLSSGEAYASPVKSFTMKQILKDGII